MPSLVIEGIAPYDGTYEFEIDSFTNRELHRIKLATGLRAGELEDAFASGDNDILIALAIVVIERGGTKVDDALLWDSPAGSGITFELGAEEVEEDLPPAEPLDSEPRNDGSPSGSGASTASSSENLPSDPSPTGHPDLLRSVPSAPEILAS